MFGFSLSPKGVSAPEAFEKIGADGHVLVDVRSPGEVAALGVNGAKNIPLERLEAALDELRGYPSIHLLCRSGGRSGMAAQMLHAAGLTHAMNVDGGLLAWEQTGLPTTRG